MHVWRVYNMKKLSYRGMSVEIFLLAAQLKVIEGHWNSNSRYSTGRINAGMIRIVLQWNALHITSKLTRSTKCNVEPVCVKLSTTIRLPTRLIARDVARCHPCEISEQPRPIQYLLEHSNSGKKSFDSIRFDNLINLPLVHWYSNSKLGVIFIVCIA